MMVQQLFRGGLAKTITPSTSVRFVPIYGDDSNGQALGTSPNGSSYCDLPMPIAGTFRRLRVVALGTNNAHTVTFTVQKNGVDTALTVTVTGTGATDTQLDSTHDVTVAVGDIVRIGYLGSHTSLNPSTLSMHVEWVPDDGVSSIYFTAKGGSTDTHVPAPPEYHPVLRPHIYEFAGVGAIPTHAYDDIGEDIVAAPGTITSVYALLNAIRLQVFADATSGADYTINLIKNGVVQDGSGGSANTTISLVAGGTGVATATATYNLHVDAGDRLVWQLVKNTGDRRAVAIGFALVPDIPNQYTIAAAHYVIDNTTTYLAPLGGDCSSQTAIPIGPKWASSVVMQVSAMYVRAKAAPGAGKSWTCELWNGAGTPAATGLSVTISDSAVAGSATGVIKLEDDTDSYVANVPTGGPTRGTGGIATLTFGFLIEPWTPPVAEITQFFLEAATDEDLDNDPAEIPVECSGGGTVAPGTNPAAGVSLSTASTPLAWVELTIGSTVYRWAGIGIPHGLPKTARVVGAGRIARALSDLDGVIEAATYWVVLDDTDRVLRALRNSGTLRHARLDVFVADIATVRAGATPWRVFRGLVIDGQPESDLQFRLEAEDVFSARFNALDAGDQPIPRQLIDEDISDQTPIESMFGKAVPLLYGELSRTDGAWECPYVGTAVAEGYESLGGLYWFLVSLGVVSVRTAFVGTLATTLPRDRVQVREALFGETIFAPGHAGWIEPDDWSERGDRRYTLIAGLPSSPAIRQAKEGRIPLVVEVCGYDTVGDRSASPSETITNPARVLLHFLNNFVAQEATANWLSMASFGDYSLFDVETFEAVNDYTDTLLGGDGYKCAGAIAADFEARGWRDQVATLTRSFGFDVGINRHGQMVLVMLDRVAAAAPVATFTAAHVLEHSLTVDAKAGAVENEVRYVYERNYLSTLPDPAPAENARLPNDPFSGEWYSGLQTIRNATSVTALGGDPIGVRRSDVQEYSMVRDAATADAVAAERLALLSPANGRAEATFELSLKHGADLELGDLIALEHWDLPWNDSRVCQVRRLELDLDRLVVTVTARDVDDLLP